MPLLTACGPAKVRLALPPIERTAPVAFPAIPIGEATCGTAPCLSDREAATVMADLAKALDEANTKLLWLRDWVLVAGR